MTTKKEVKIKDYNGKYKTLYKKLYKSAINEVTYDLDITEKELLGSKTNLIKVLKSLECTAEYRMHKLFDIKNQININFNIITDLCEKLEKKYNEKLVKIAQNEFQFRLCKKDGELMLFYSEDELEVVLIKNNKNNKLEFITNSVCTDNYDYSQYNSDDYRNFELNPKTYDEDKILKMLADCV